MLYIISLQYKLIYLHLPNGCCSNLEREKKAPCIIQTEVLENLGHKMPSTSRIHGNGIFTNQFAMKRIQWGNRSMFRLSQKKTPPKSHRKKYPPPIDHHSRTFNHPSPIILKKNEVTHIWPWATLTPWCYFPVFSSSFGVDSDDGRWGWWDDLMPWDLYIVGHLEHWERGFQKGEVWLKWFFLASDILCGRGWGLGGWRRLLGDELPILMSYHMSMYTYL